MTDIDLGGLATFLEGGNSIVVATRNAMLEPFATRATAIRVVAADRIVVLLPLATSQRTLADLEANGDVAVCVSWPRDFRTYQMKGRCAGVGECTPEDLLASEQQLQGFATAVAPFGNTRAQCRNLWRFDSCRAEIRVTSLYMQSPGPGAGTRMGRAG